MHMTDPPAEIWIDVGAHLGEKTFAFAQQNPALRVYAFEPNLQVALERLGRLPNFVVVPVAVSEQDGCADFYLNAFAAASAASASPEGGARIVASFGSDVRSASAAAIPSGRPCSWFSYDFSIQRRGSLLLVRSCC